MVNASPVYEFGGFKLNPVERVLLRDDQPVALPPKAFDLLVFFLERPGRLVLKQELMSALWADTFVEESNLSYTVSVLRSALGNGQEGERFIETVPKKGYRFVAPVSRIAAAPEPAVEPSTAVVVPTDRFPGRVGRPLGLVAIVVVLALGTFAGRAMLGDPDFRRTPAFSQLTTDTGLTTDPALSPDGRWLSYASDRGGGGTLDIWIRPVAGGEPAPLTRSPFNDREPTFSPDGAWIAFRSDRDGGGIFVMSAAGGTARKVAPDGQRPRFSPDGRYIAYWTGFIGGSAGFSARNRCRIFVVPTGGGAPLQLRSDFLGAAYPVWISERDLLFLGNRDEQLPFEEAIDWWITPLDDGPPVRTGALKATRAADLLSPFFVYPSAVVPGTWQPSRASLIFSARSGDTIDLWSIRLSPTSRQAVGAPERLTTGAAPEEQPTTATHPEGALRIAFTSLGENRDIWRLPIDADAGSVTGEPQQLTRDSAADYQGHISPDGRRMVFVSTRSGRPELWIKDLRTGQDARLTANGVEKYNPAFSPDGEHLSFAVHKDNKWDVYVLPAAGGAPERVCEDCGQATTWSLDGRYLLGNSLKGRVTLVDVPGRSHTDLVGGKDRWYGAPRLSPDGRWASFLDLVSYTQFIAPFRDGKLAPEADWRSMIAQLRLWSPGGTLLYGESRRDGFVCLWAQRLDPTTREPVGAPFPIYHAHHPRFPITGATDLTDGQLYFTVAERTGNVWMAEWR